MTQNRNKLNILTEISAKKLKQMKIWEIEKQKIIKNIFRCKTNEQLRNQQQFCYVALLNNNIAFSEDDQIYYSLALDYQLKLNITHQQNGNIKSPMIGFSLKNEEIGLNIYLTDSNVETVKTWINLLTKRINRIGFKQYFKPIQRLGKGGCAVVYEVESLLDSRRYAAKAFSKANLSRQDRTMEGLKNQINIMRNLSHKNVMELYGVYQSANSIYFLLQLFKGGNLLERLDTKNNKFKLTDDKIKGVISEILKGLDYLHSQGIVHRDLKLQNIMLRSLTSFQPVIIDFGFSVQQEKIGSLETMPDLLDDSEEKQKQIESLIFKNCGTPGYLAPQIFQQKKSISDINPKSDIFALGVILYMIAAKKPLYFGGDWKQVLKCNRQGQYQIDNYLRMNQDIHDLLLKMLEKTVQKRISAEEAIKHSYFGPYIENMEQISSKQQFTAFSQRQE